MPRCLLTLLALAGAVLAPASAQLPFDLVEITEAGHPAHPGIDFVFLAPNSTQVESGGLAVADVDEDGWLDVMLPAPEGQASALYINQGNGTFTDQAADFGVDETAKRRAMATFFDMDNDGDLDLLTVGYPGPSGSNLDLFTLFRNDGAPDFHFTDVTASAGGFALAPTQESTTIGDPGGFSVADVDRNGFLDVIATWWQDNDIYGGGGPIINLDDQPRLFLNQVNPAPPPGGAGYSPRLLLDGSLAAGLDTFVDGLIFMPTLWDVNRDGWPDLHLNVEAGPDLLRLNDQGVFGPDIGSAVGLNTNGTFYGNEMGVALGDYDNDLDFDLVVTNAGYGPADRRDILYRNDCLLQLGDGGIGFADVSTSTGVHDDLAIGWGAAFADLDNDGDLDLLRGRGLAFPVANSVLENGFPALSSDGATIALEDVSDQLPGFTKAGLSPNDQDLMRGVVTFDFDHDGDLDVLAARTGWDPLFNNAAILHTGVFLNTLDNGHHWLQVDLRETGGSRNTIGARLWARAGGPQGTVQVREVRNGESFLCQAPDRQHFGFGAELPDWLVVRWMDGSHTVLRGPGIPGTPGPMPTDAVITVTHDDTDATGDLNGDGAVDCADAELLEQALFNALPVAAAQPDWPWRLLADVDGNGALEPADLGALTLLMGSPWCPVGGGVAGTHGVPSLSGSGALLQDQPIQIVLADALENSSFWILAGLAPAELPFNGGTLVPQPDIIVGPLPTGPAGTLPLVGHWPGGLPAGLDLWLQAWVADGAAPFGYAGSDGLKTTLP